MMLKKIFAVFLIAAVFLFFLPITGAVFPLAADWQSVLTFQSNAANTEIIVTGCSREAAGVLTIPSQVYDLPVTQIGAGAFIYCDALTTITIPDTVTSIYNTAFYGCTALESITLPSELTTIEDYTFYNCVSLGGITLPSTLTSIGSYAFYNCKTAEYITVPAGVTSIGSSAFFGCSSLQSITIPAGVTYLEDGFFEGCASLEHIGVAFGNTAFSSVDGILYNYGGTLLIRCPQERTGEVIVPSAVTAVGDSAFSACVFVSGITLPTSVIAIGYYAFAGCDLLEEMNIPDSVEYIGNFAFINCASLQSLTIPESVNEMDISCFNGCGALSAINVNASNPLYSSVDGVLYSKDMTRLVLCPKGKTGLCVIALGVTQIESGAFTDCSLLTDVSVPAGVSTIDGDVFYNCTALSSVTIDAENSYYTSVDGLVYNKSVTSLIFCPLGKSGACVVADSAVSINQTAFRNCAHLTEIAIPSNVAALSENYFYGCTSLKSILVSGTNPYYCDVDGVLFTKDITKLLCFPQGKDGAYDIPAGVVSVESSSFYNCDALSAVSIPQSVEEIGQEAFAGCDLLSSITAESGLVTVKPGAFEGTAYYTDESKWENSVLYIGGCLIKAKENLSDIYTIKNGTYCVADEAFYACMDLTRVVVPDSVKEIGARAFSECASLTDIALSCALVSVRQEVFAGCTSLETVSLPESVKTIGDCAFYNCLSLTRLFMRYGLEQIGIQAALHCPLLDNVSIPDTVTDIGESAFGFYFNDYGESAILPGFQIYCYLNTAGLQYALDNGVTYQLIAPKLELSFASKAVVETASDTVCFNVRMMTVEDLISQFSRPGVTAYRGDTPLDNGEYIGTGCEVKLVNGAQILDTMGVVILGDVSGDAVVDALDVYLTDSAIGGHIVLNSVYFTAANLDVSNTELDIADYSAVMNLALNKIA